MIARMKEKVKGSLVKHEGYKTHPYVDTVGKITIGIGYNLTDRGISDDWIMSQFEKDIDYFYCQLSCYDWFNKLNEDRQTILIDMSFMGMKKLLGFKKMIAAIENDDFEEAERQMLDSNWAHQTGNRSIELANAMKTGIYTV